jgi:uncharacterized SAM-dependent methyltransferase
MLHFNNQELATANHVSVRTVRNWIESARTGKLSLTLLAQGERWYVANTSKNLKIIEGLVSNGKKYRPHRSQRTVTPKPEFYSLYTQEQLYDIVSNLEINHEIPPQYNYFGDGANNWDDYAKRLVDEEATNMLKATVELLDTNAEYIDILLARYDQINVVDIGPGNVLPIKAFLTHLIDQGKLGRYIGLDISPTMLTIAESNIKKWFDGQISFEGYSLDIDHDRFGNLLADEYIKTNHGRTANVILFLGGTIANFKNPDTVLRSIHDSMGVNDFFIHQQKLDTQTSRRYFDFNPTPSTARLAPMDQYIFDLLNIDESLYEVDMGFDVELNERYIRVELKVALSIHFEFQNGQRTIYFNKGDGILLWRHRQNNVVELMSQFMKNNLYPLQVSQTNDQEFVLTISRIKHD